MDALNIRKQFRPQYPVSLVDQIREFLSSAIIEGRLKGGQRLGENELQRQFKVSRAPIRESFRILEKNGLVVTVPRKGTFVRTITRKDIEENFPIRASLESLAARLSVPNLKQQDIERMKLALSRMTDAAEKNDFKSYLHHHAEYHRVFISASQNDTLMEILENLRRQALWFRFSYLYVQESYKYAIRVHKKILDLFIGKDAYGVEALVKEHILIALDRFLQFLGQRNEEKARKEEEHETVRI